MRDRRGFHWVLLGVVLLSAGAGWTGTRQNAANLGRPATRAEIDGMDLTVDADGDGLPPGSGTPAEGEALFKINAKPATAPPAKAASPIA